MKKCSVKGCANKVTHSDLTKNYCTFHRIKENKDAELKSYKCRYCGFAFEEMVRKGQVAEEAVSTQVKCRCGNFLKTWGEE